MFAFVHLAPGTRHSGVSLTIFGVNDCKCEAAMNGLLGSQEKHLDSCIANRTSDAGH